MLSLLRLTVVTPFLVGMLVACGSESPNRATGNNPTPEMLAASPKMLIARVAQRDLDSKAAKIEFVAVNQNIRISNGQDAERAFQSGSPITFTNEKSAKSMSLNEQAGSSFTMNFTGQAPASAVPPCPIGMTCADTQVVGYGGQPVGIFGAIFQGLFTKIRNLLSLLNPFNWFGNNGVSYGYQGQYGFGNYQYATYPQMPSLPPGYGSIPVQPGYGPTPVTPGYGPTPVTPGYGPTPVTPGYGSTPTQPNYGGGGLPQNPGYPQNSGYPQYPQGMEPMPAN